MAAYQTTFTLDFGTVPLPAPWKAIPPLGSLVYEATVSGSIGSPDDADSFQIDLDPGQTITVVVDPDSSLRVQVEVTYDSTSIGSAHATSVGATTVLQTAPATEAGAYTITVRGIDSSIGVYALRAILNAAVECEPNNVLSNVQDIDASFIPLAGGATRGVVWGGIEDTGYLGPDGFGYEAGSTHTSPPVPISHQFEDISATGIRLTELDGKDDAAVGAQ